MGLSDDVGRIASAAVGFGGPGEEVVAVLAVESADGNRLYLCGFAGGGEPAQTWLVLDEDGAPITSRKRVLDAASIAALCEVAEETADVASDGEPRVASLAYLDSLSSSTGNGDLAVAIQGALPAVDELAKDVEANYKLQLTS